MPKLPRLPSRKIVRVLEHNDMPRKRRATHGDLHVHVTDHSRRAEVPVGRETVSPRVLGIIIETSKKSEDEFRDL